MQASSTSPLAGFGVRESLERREQAVDEQRVLSIPVEWSAGLDAIPRQMIHGVLRTFMNFRGELTARSRRLGPMEGTRPLNHEGIDLR